VDFPRKQPNYLRFSLLSMISRIQRETNDSSTLDSDAVREIGLMSDVMSLGGFCFGTGITLANFHSCLSHSDALNIAVKGSLQKDKYENGSNFCYINRHLKMV